MSSLEQLNQQFSINGQVQFVQSDGDHIIVDVKNHHARASISLHGGQVLSYLPSKQEVDLFFLSDKTSLEEGKAIRGGIPICWPWFGDYEPGSDLPGHGFARNQNWTVLETLSLDDGTTIVRLSLKHSVGSLAVWPYEFELVLEVSIGKTLILTLMTKNIGNQAFSISEALHSYLRVGDIKQIKIKGLDNLVYLDKANHYEQKKQSGDLIISNKTDRLYDVHSGSVVLIDESLNRQIKMNFKTNNTTVIWNPWSELAASMTDLDDNAYQKFICIEAVNSDRKSIKIAPKEQHYVQAEFQLL